MKKILVVIDCQNDFITGSLKNEEAIATVPNIVGKIKNEEWDAIFATKDTHNEDYLTTPEGEKLPVEHCIFGTEGWMIEKSIAEALEEKGFIVTYINKPTFGSFDLVDRLYSYIKDMAFLPEGEKVYIEFVGFCTDICVVSNALMAKAKLYDLADICVDERCCAGTSLDAHNAAVQVMKSCQIDIKPAYKMQEMTHDEVKDLLCELGYEDAVVFEDPEYDAAIIGVTEDSNVIYSYEKMIEVLMKEMSYEDAVDFISYNTIRAIPYCHGNKPIISFGIPYINI